jgi:catechol 2,3-dioxygenase-like lactoylglutathione lyase family enzyme
VISRIALVALLAGTTVSAQPESPVVGIGPFLHIVADLDQSIEFYHDKLGLELSRPAGQKFTDDPAVANLYGVPGKQFRAAVLKIPGSPMGIELVQWGEARKPKGELISGPGVATLIIRRAETTKTLQDPDGFPVRVEQSENPAADLSVSVADVRKATALYDTVLGLKSDRIRFAKENTGDGRDVPFPQPGQGMLRVFVRNVDRLTASLKDAGFPVITTGGVPVTLPQGQRVIILRDPDNFYLQLMQNPQK